MAIDTTSLLTCTYGSAGFVLSSYDYSEEPVLAPGLGRVATKISVKCRGFIDQTQIPGAAAAFQAKLAAVTGQLRLDAQNFSITGLGAKVELSIAAAACLDGGPFVKLRIKDGSGPLHKLIDFDLVSTVNSAQSRYNYKARASYSPDDLLTMTWRGVINATQSNVLFAQQLLIFEALYAAPSWIVHISRETSTDPLASQTSYTFIAQQCLNPMPAGGGATAVDGEATERKETDEQHRLVTVMDFDFLIIGDPVQFHTFLRGQIINTGATIFRESFSTTSIKGRRVRSSFTTIASADGQNGLISWRQTVQTVYDQTQYREITFAGADPILVQKPMTMGRIMQRGSATAVGQYVAEPDPVNQWHLQLPEVTFEAEDTLQFRTTWSFVMAASDPTNSNNQLNFDLGMLVRPNSPSFTTQSDG